jgi:hypothetical protein
MTAIKGAIVNKVMPNLLLARAVLDLAAQTCAAVPAPDSCNAVEKLLWDTAVTTAANAISELKDQS